ncbi:MAG: hypothetical protein GOV00_00650 [Candidatus Altiarchaeota archaeon]|nr:hypothetical protein [Candidatus Altiarchaeota archaeon]
MLGTNFFYPFVLILSLGMVIYALSKLKVSKHDLKPLFFLLLVSSALLFLNTPQTLVFGEFFYMEGAENLANNLFSSSFQASSASRPLGPSLLYSIPMKLGLDVFTSAHLVNLFFHLLSPLILFLAVKKWKGSKTALAMALMFSLNFTWLRLQKTATSELSSTFFLLLSVLFFIYYVKERRHRLPLVAALSFFFHLRPENFLIAFPFVVFFIFNELKSKPSRKAILLLAFLLFNFGFASFHMLSKTPTQITWELAPEIRMKFFSQHFVDNLRFFTTLPFFNIFLFPLAALALFKGKRPDEVASIFLIAFLIAFLALTSFNSGDFFITSGSSVRYSMLPMALLLLFLSFFLEGKPVLFFLVVLSTVLLLFPQLYYPSIDGELLERVQELPWFTSSQKIIFSPPSALSFLYPNKTIFEPGCECNLSGDYLLIRHQSEALLTEERSSLHLCNKTLLLQDTLISGAFSVFNVSCG